MTHTHATETTRALPFGGVTISECECGARLRSDGQRLYGASTDAQGWQVEKPVRARSAYDRLQSEGYDDEQDSHDSEDAFAVPGAE